MGGNQPITLSEGSVIKTLKSSGVSHLASPASIQGFPASVSISLFPFLACSLSLPLSSLAFSVSSFLGISEMELYIQVLIRGLFWVFLLLFFTFYLETISN